MKKIFRHIEYLLLEHDHVIIPQLGGFVANNMPSSWSEEEELFLPPYRTVHFNANLNHGDSTLVDSLASMYSITPAEAEKWCAQFVQSIHMELAENGSLDFGSIGVMIQESADQPITFSPCKAGVTTPSLYGLDAFHMPMLAQGGTVKVNIHKPKEEKAEKRKRTHSYTLHINRHLAHTVAAVAAAVILFVLFSTPIENPVQRISQVNQAELFIPSHLITGFQMPALTTENIDDEAEPEETLIMVQEEPLAQENEAEAEVAAETEESPTAETPTEEMTEQAPVQKGIAIVLASAISQSNAEAYANDLQSRGYDAHVYQRDKMVRVIIPCYDGEENARRRLNQMKQSGNEFKQAWITPLD
ncbi:MAG: SPOR domain-containing protein [Bacteroidaceae bacterium]|nr:SPOR domain-containing protein [Bacteroidaceae bacterium]